MTYWQYLTKQLLLLHYQEDSQHDINSRYNKKADKAFRLIRPPYEKFILMELLMQQLYY